MSPGFESRLPRLVWVELAVVLSLTRRGETGEERGRQTLCDKRDNNFDWKKGSSKLNPPLNRSFWKRPENINLSEETTKHASNSPVTFVTNKRFAVLLRKLTIFSLLSCQMSLYKQLFVQRGYDGWPLPFSIGPRFHDEWRFLEDLTGRKQAQTFQWKTQLPDEVTQSTLPAISSPHGIHNDGLVKRRHFCVFPNWCCAQCCLPGCCVRHKVITSKNFWNPCQLIF